MNLLKTINIKKNDSKLLIILFSLFILISIIIGVDSSFLLVMSLWVLLMYYSLVNIKSRMLLSFFLISFFVFLLGGHFVYEYLGMEIRHYLGEEYYKHSNLTMAASLIFLLVGTVAVEQILKYRSQKENNIIDESNVFNGDNNNKILKNVSKLLYISTYIFYAYVVLDKVLFVINNSYYAYYVEYERNISFIIVAIGTMAPYFFYIFLATLPPKKEAMPLILLQIGYAILTLFTGRRIDFILIMLFIAIYFIFRNYYNPGLEKWINKKHVVWLIIFSPFFIVALFLYNYLRHGIDVSGFSVKEALFGFFQQQGFSSSIIRLALYNEDVLRDDAYYSFFGVIRFIRKNSLISLIFNPQYDFSYSGNSVDFALKGNSLAHTLSYYTASGYLSGAGLGSCYIAELYHDFGYAGISLGNFVYGALISIVNFLWMRVKKYNIWTTAIGFSLVESFLKAPRWNFDIVFADFLSLGRWTALLIVFILYKLLINEKIKKYLRGNMIGKVIYGN